MTHGLAIVLGALALGAVAAMLRTAIHCGRSMYATQRAVREAWDRDCMRWWGRKLTGKRQHFCPEWDYLPIDDTCHPEIECCTCHKS